jgi:hypothetical protein
MSGIVIEGQYWGGKAHTQTIDRPHESNAYMVCEPTGYTLVSPEILISNEATIELIKSLSKYQYGSKVKISIEFEDSSTDGFKCQ